ncbi:anthocyanidin 3-O-glucoside 2''-O-glucosyltransferase-like [Hibiscus syriacus]|uniref:anthocyanidin 3-O-glucoside 2''-O-glucosyltransferase-like n=1 Tax=Hibiscus syriacus TaxID=106335 RepID=UPI001923DF1A|nr:anthocyanidin 3-O-glucoside 2''-O-glucosyltransferase-like [Hibiscus syriacus]
MKQLMGVEVHREPTIPVKTKEILEMLVENDRVPKSTSVLAITENVKDRLIRLAINFADRAVSKKPVLYAGPVVLESPKTTLEEQWEKLLSRFGAGTVIFCAFRSSLVEGMVNDCQLVLLPHFGDQIINARLMARDLRTGVEVEKGEENGLFTKDDICRAVKTVMDDGNELGKETRSRGLTMLNGKSFF